jgi:hypothetical protein
MGKLFEYLTKQLVAKGFKKAISEGSLLWVGIAALGLVVQFFMKHRQPKVAVEKLRLGESIVISHLARNSSSTAKTKIY